MTIAFVYDRINKFGGAERVLQTLHEVWPDAPLYTSVYNPDSAPWAKDFDVRPSFLNTFPLFRNHHEFLPQLMPMAFESFDFSDFDVVLSITSAEAKSIITPSHTLHITYCLTPTRYYWSGYHEYIHEPGFGVLNQFIRSYLPVTISSLRRDDYIYAQRPDKYIAISQAVARRIQAYYKKPIEVIFPPVRDILPVKTLRVTGEFFLIVSRLVPYKHIDYAIDACEELGLQLKIIGTGNDEQRLRKRVKGSTEIITRGLTDEELGWYYEHSKAVLLPQEEDFGIVAVEAQAYGKPVVGYNGGGIKDILSDGETGILYQSQTKESLQKALTSLERFHIDPVKCIDNARRFSKNTFKRHMKQIVETYWNQLRRNI